MLNFLLAVDQLDRSLLKNVNSLVGISSALDLVLRVIAEWFIYLTPLLLLGAWFWLRFSARSQNWLTDRIRLVEFTAAGLLAWQILSRIIKAFYFRERPISAGNGVKEVFFHRPDESFPSDHAAFLFALTAYAYLLGWRRVGHALLLVSLLISSARIITGTHWFSDILAGTLLGIASAFLLWKFRVQFRHYFAAPVTRLINNLGL
ncbi:phosphatase PAP2 family protein [Candidatus Berkelbacteria bacterium]|nr:phosphatase PAP2 family protein [Candidatus Berkelbacteria bacterium]